MDDVMHSLRFHAFWKMDVSDVRHQYCTSSRHATSAAMRHDAPITYFAACVSPPRLLSPHVKPSMLPVPALSSRCPSVVTCIARNSCQKALTADPPPHVTEAKLWGSLVHNYLSDQLLASPVSIHRNNQASTSPLTRVAQLLRTDRWNF